MSETNNKSSNPYLKLIIILPIIWGLIGLIEGKGFFPYIFENIKALFYLLIGFIILVVIIEIFAKE